MKGINKAMALIAAAVMALGTAPVIVANAEVAPIVIQAEEMSAVGHYVDGTLVKSEKDTGKQSYAGQYPQQLFGSVDFAAWYYDSSKDITPTHGETGSGAQLASWGNVFYAIMLRANNNTTAGQLKEAYYTINAPYAGDYDLDIYGYTYYNNVLLISVNDSAAVQIDNIDPYNDGTKHDIFKQTTGKKLTLNKGENTLKVTIGRQQAVIDKFELTFAGEVPQEPETNTKIKHVELTVQAEEMAAVGHYVDGALVKSEKDAGKQSYAGQYPQQLFGSVDFAAWYYDSSKDITPTHGETGAGAQLASWGNVFYAITLRANNNTAAGQLKEAYYTVDAPYAGEYTLDIYGYGLWDPTLSFYLNGSSKAIQVGGIDPFNDGSAGHSIIKQETGKIFNLNKGENTIKVTVNKQTAVLDKFVLSADIEVETEAVAPYDTDADTAVSAKDTKDNGDGTFNTAYAARDVSISDFNSIKFYFTKLDAENTPVERIRFKYPLAELSIEGNGAVSFDVTVTNIPEKYNQTEMWLSSDAAAE